MFKTNLKNKKGFSLVELMVVVAIMGTLAAIAIPAYNEYRKSAKKSAYKADLTSLHKGWLAFGVELDSFCERRTNPQESSIKNVGMESLFSSKLYGNRPGNQNFIGFGAAATGAQSCGSSYTFVLDHSSNGSDTAHGFSDVVGSVPGACTLGVTTYRMGVAGHVSGTDSVGFDISQSGVIKEQADADYADVIGTAAICT